ncbi:copper amine oxidase N-terminal domain-containing protein [Paenibacillus sp. sptzw28]|uniref:copper amine oxidase N-terminal domain-containing protein n=1 Tax=Paenibacillus sp. sptzw28 TaxID=715179 RepID=UPI001C6EA3F9|nr:copper amine oxidase N-terminal domain-containing protein [Paenibacillus sp. sptzw28]QYR21978.1 copper amine oxidase N-terminal domain-containing protein [Paenibacillus sp. sptzw28]
MNKKMAMIITLCFCVIGMSACGKAAVEGQNVASHMVQASEVAETTQVTEKTSSCETPPKFLVWSKKTYYLKETHSTAEPMVHYGYMKCENGSYTQTISDTAEFNVYSAGPSSDLLYYGEWGGKRGYALYSLGVPGIPVNAAATVKSVKIEYANDRKANLNNEEYILIRGSILVSPSYVTDVLPFLVPGKGIWWNNEQKTLSFAFTDKDDYIKERFLIKIGEKKFKDNNKIFPIRQEAILKNGRVYLPLRGIAEAYGNVVKFTKSNGLVTISIEQ